MMELVEKYYLTVIGDYERKPMEFEEVPSKEVIANAIFEQKGRTARLEKRFVLVENSKG